MNVIIFFGFVKAAKIELQKHISMTFHIELKLILKVSLIPTYIFLINPLIGIPFHFIKNIRKWYKVNKFTFKSLRKPYVEYAWFKSSLGE